jgi:hypothetical protein
MQFHPKIGQIDLAHLNLLGMLDSFTFLCFGKKLALGRCKYHILLDQS